jgi:hypothetical protein
MTSAKQLATRSRSVLLQRGVAAPAQRWRRMLSDALAGVSGRVWSCMMPLAQPLALPGACAAEIRAVVELQKRCEPVSGRSRRRRGAAVRRLRPSGGMLRWHRWRLSPAPAACCHDAGGRGARLHRWGACKGPLRCRLGVPPSPKPWRGAAAQNAPGESPRAPRQRVPAFKGRTPRAAGARAETGRAPLKRGAPRSPPRRARAARRTQQSCGQRGNHPPTQRGLLLH